MARTINRTPYTVSEPDIRYKFFNHNNWKGVCDDKNFLGVDQESFADAKNVYIDSEGVLKTRPSVVEKSFSDLTDCTVYDAQTYENTLVLKVHLMNDKYDAWYYKIYKNNEYLGPILTTEKSKILLFDNKLIIFNEPSIEVKPYACYDLVNELYAPDASSLIYVPIANVYSSEGTVTKSESKNILTNDYKNIYVYSILGMPYQADGQYLYYYIDNKMVVLGDYSQKTEKYIMSKKYVLGDESATGINSSAVAYLNTDPYKMCLYQYIPKVPVSCAGKAVLKCIGSNVLCDTSAFNVKQSYQYIVTSLSYASDGLKFSSVKEFPNGYVAKNGLPVLSKDGSTIYAVLSSNDTFISSTAYLYALTISPSITSPKYDNWTLIYTFTDKIVYADITAEDDANFNIPYIYNSKYTGVCYSENNTVANRDYNSVAYTKRYSLLDDTVFTMEYTSSGNLYVFVHQGSTVKSFYFSITMDNSKSLLNLYAIPVEILKNKTTAKYEVKFYYLDRDNYGHSVVLNFPFVITKQEDIIMTDTETGPGSGNYDCMYVISEVNSVVYLTSYTELSSTNISYSTNSNDGEYASSELMLLLPTSEYLGGLWADGGNAVITNVLSPDEKINLYSYQIAGGPKSVLPDFISTLNQNVIAIGNKTYIDANRESEDLSKKLLYFPEALLKRYDYDVNALHPISTSQMGVFFDDSVWIIQRSENKLTDTIYPDYLYTKSQVHVGLTKGSDVVTSYDGKNVIFATQRGLVAMSYQDFIASTDQSLTYLSDSILVPFVNYCKDSAVKIFLFRYWLIVYKQNAAKIYVIDLRNGSWWPMEYKQGLVSACVNDGVPLLVSDGSLFAFNTDDESCKDWDNTLIVWKLLSQKLHFNAPNYYKHLYSLTINAVNDSQKPIAYLLGTTNYRNIANVNSDEVMNYQVDIIRSYVKRMNYSKVNEFQYELRNSKSTPSRLSISNITLKYTITSLVR